MSSLFSRVVRVSVGPRGAARTLLIEGLRIVFKIEKTLEKTPNNTTCEIYNLSETSRAVFEKKGAAIRIEAGYGDDVKDIFIGDIATVVTKRTGADVITSVEAADGLLAYQNAEADLSFKPGAKIGTILDTLIASFGLAKGEISGVNTGDEYLNGASFSGKIRNHLDAVLGKQKDLSWSIQDGQLQVLPKKSGSIRLAVFLSPETGLIGSPFKRAVVNMDIAKKVEGKDAEAGCNFKSLLNPELSPGRLVRVESKFVQGTFKIGKVTHSGDTHAVTFYSDVEAVAL